LEGESIKNNSGIIDKFPGIKMATHAAIFIQQPSSAAVERVFSMLNNYLEASIMLRYNNCTNK